MEQGLGEALRELAARWDAETGRDPMPLLPADSEVWTTVGWRWQLRELVNERDGVATGRVLAAPPAEPDEFMRYGLDASGRLLWTELSGPPGQRTVDVREYAPDRVWQVRRDGGGQLQSITRAVLEGQHPVQVAEYVRSASSMNLKIEQYTRDSQGQVIQIHIAGWDRVPHDTIPSIDTAMVSVEDIVRRSHGVIERIDHTFFSANGPVRDTVYVRPEDSEAECRKQLGELRIAMRSAVATALDQRGRDTCAIAFRYEGEDPLPPYLVWLDRAERDALDAAGEDCLDPANWQGAGSPVTVALEAHGFTDETAFSNLVRTYGWEERVADVYVKAIKDALKGYELPPEPLAVYAVPFGADPEPYVVRTTRKRVLSALACEGA